MRTLVLPGGATSVLGGPADTAADVAGAVRALEGVGPSVRPSWGPSVVVVVVVVVAAVAAAARSSRSIVPLSTQSLAHGARRKFRGSFGESCSAVTSAGIFDEFRHLRAWLRCVCRLD